MSTLEVIPRGETGSATSPEAAFWDWFLAHEALLWSAEDDLEPFLDGVMSALYRVDPDLVFEIGSEREGRREFVVSADGNRAAFPAVVRLTQAAPPLARWTVTAFRPRRPVEGELWLSTGHVVRLADVRFAAAPAEGKVDIALFIPGITRRYRDAFGQMAMLLMDVVLGEFDVETRVCCVAVGPPLPHVRSRPLAELPALVDAMTGN